MSQCQAMKSRGLLNPPFLFMYCLGEDGARVSPGSREIGTKIPGGGWEWSSVATGNPVPHGFDQEKGRKVPSEELLRRLGCEDPTSTAWLYPQAPIRKGTELTGWVFFGNKPGEHRRFLLLPSCSGLTGHIPPVPNVLLTPHPDFPIPRGIWRTLTSAFVSKPHKIPIFPRSGSRITTRQRPQLLHKTKPSFFPKGGGTHLYFLFWDTLMA